MRKAPGAVLDDQPTGSRRNAQAAPRTAQDQRARSAGHRAAGIHYTAPSIERRRFRPATQSRCRGAEVLSGRYPLPRRAPPSIDRSDGKLGLDQSCAPPKRLCSTSRSWAHDTRPRTRHPESAAAPPRERANHSIDTNPVPGGAPSVVLPPLSAVIHHCATAAPRPHRRRPPRHAPAGTSNGYHLRHAAS